MSVEKIWLAAIKTNNGLIFTGKNHSDCIQTAIRLNLLTEHFSQDKQGFVTSVNRYVDRKEAAQIAYKAGQINKPKEILLSEDLQALAELSEKPEPTDKTVGIREFVHDANRDFQADRIKGTHIEDYVRALRELKELCDEIDRLNARNKVKQELLEVTENMLNIKIAENKQQAERIEELEGTLSKDNTPEIDHKYINNIAKEVRAEFEQPEPSEFTKEKLFFNPEQPTCPICHTTLYLEDGMEWSDNPIHNCCCDCQSNIIDRLTERIQELEKYIASRKDFVDPSKP